MMEQLQLTQPEEVTRKGKAYTQETIQLAKENYISGKPITEISKEKGIPEITLYAWKKKFNWDDEKKFLQRTTNQVMWEQRINSIIDARNKNLKNYVRVKESALDAIEDPDIEWKDKGQAASAIDMAIKGEKALTAELIPLQFIEDIAQIIVDTVNDPITAKKLIEQLILLGKLWTTGEKFTE